MLVYGWVHKRKENDQMEKHNDILEELILKLSKITPIPREEIRCSLENLIVSIGNDSKEKKQEIIEFPVKDLLADYMSGKSVSNLTEALKTEIEIVKKFGLYTEKGTLQEYDRVKHNMFVRLHNTITDCDLLENAIYSICGDIALTVYWRAESGNTRYYMRMPRKVLGVWWKSKETMIQDALYNTLAISPPRKYDLMNWLTGQECVGDIASDAGWDNGPLGNCISTDEITFGSVAIFLPGVAKEIADIYQGDFYFAFPSQHEVMVHNAQNTDPEMIGNSIEHLTESREDFLSYHVFQYFRATGKIGVIF